MGYHGETKKPAPKGSDTCNYMFEYYLLVGTYQYPSKHLPQ